MNHSLKPPEFKDVLVVEHAGLVYWRGLPEVRQHFRMICELDHWLKKLSEPKLMPNPKEKAMSNHAALLILATALVLPAAAQNPDIKKVPARYTSPASGSEMYMAYCASCHGVKGLGGGPVAEHLKITVPDLTTLSKQNKGAFPAVHVTQVIRGEVGVRSHGIQDMPVWGPVFLNLNNRQEAAVHMRVSNLAKYIESLQAK